MWKPISQVKDVELRNMELYYILQGVFVAFRSWVWFSIFVYNENYQRNSQGGLVPTCSLAFLLFPDFSMECFFLSLPMENCGCPIPWDSHETSNAKCNVSCTCLISSLHSFVIQVPHIHPLEGASVACLIFVFVTWKGLNNLFSGYRITSAWQWASMSNTFCVVSIIWYSTLEYASHMT